jgi:hypothetical protein
MVIEMANEYSVEMIEKTLAVMERARQIAGSANPA